MNVRELLNTAAPLYAFRPLIVFGDRNIGYDEFVDLTDRLSAALIERGLGAGDRVMILAKNSPEWIAGYFAILGCGAIAVPVNPALTPHEVAYIVDHAAPKAALIDTDFESSLTGKIPHLVTLGPGGN